MQWRIRGEGHSVKPRFFGQKKSAMVIKSIKQKKTWFVPFVKALAARQEIPLYKKILNTSLSMHLRNEKPDKVFFLKCFTTLTCNDHLTCNALTCNYLTCNDLTCNDPSCNDLTCNDLTCNDPLVMISPVMISPVMISPVMVSPVMISPVMISPVMISPVMISPVMISHVMISPVLISPVMISPVMIIVIVGQHDVPDSVVVAFEESPKFRDVPEPCRRITVAGSEVYHGQGSGWTLDDVCVSLANRKCVDVQLPIRVRN